MKNLETQKRLLIESFAEYIQSLSITELCNFIFCCDNELKGSIAMWIDDKSFSLKEGVFTCEKCHEKFGECLKENEKRTNNDEEMICAERFLQYCKE